MKIMEGLFWAMLAPVFGNAWGPTHNIDQYHCDTITFASHVVNVLQGGLKPAA